MLFYFFFWRLLCGNSVQMFSPRCCLPAYLKSFANTMSSVQLTSRRTRMPHPPKQGPTLREINAAIRDDLAAQGPGRLEAAQAAARREGGAGGGGAAGFGGGLPDAQELEQALLSGEMGALQAYLDQLQVCGVICLAWSAPMRTSVWVAAARCLACWRAPRRAVLKLLLPCKLAKGTPLNAARVSASVPMPNSAAGSAARRWWPGGGWSGRWRRRPSGRRRPAAHRSPRLDAWPGRSGGRPGGSAAA